MNKILIIILINVLFGCMKGKQVDQIFYNGKLYETGKTIGSNQAIAVKNGIIKEIGPDRQIMNKYRANAYIDLNSSYVYPTFTITMNSLFTSEELNQCDLKFTSKPTIGSLKTQIEKEIQLNKKKHIRIKQVYGKEFDQELISSVKKGFPKHKITLLNHNGTNSICIFENQSQNTEQNQVSKPSDEQMTQILIKKQQILLEQGVLTLRVLNVNEHEIELLKKLDRKNQLKIDIYCYLVPSIQLLNKISKLTSKNLKIDGITLTDTVYTTMNELLKKIKIKHFNVSASAKNSKIIDIIKATKGYDNDHRWSIYNTEEADKNTLRYAIENNFYFNYSEKNKLKPEPYSSIVFEKIPFKNTNLNHNMFIEQLSNYPVYQLFKDREQGKIAKGYQANFNLFQLCIKKNQTFFTNQTYSKGVKKYSVI